MAHNQQAATSLVAHNKVEIYLYDLSQGMAKAMSGALLGKQIDGIWHSGVVVFGHEYYYGGGIQASAPGKTMAGTPGTIIDIAYTTKTQQEFHAWLQSVAHRFQPENYSLLSHNCNNFADACTLFLCSLPIPSYITSLPQEALSTPMGQMLLPMINQMEGRMRGEGQSMAPVHAGSSSNSSSSSSYLQLPFINTMRRADKYQAIEAAAATATPAVTAAAVNLQPDGRATLTTTDAAHHTQRTTITHAHGSLQFQQLNNNSTAATATKPLTSTDSKAATFVALIKANSSKAEVTAGNKLTDAEKLLLSNSVTATQAEASAAAAAVVTATMAVFDRLLVSWPAALLFPVYGLLRILMLHPAVGYYYSHKNGNSSNSSTYIERTMLPLLSTESVSAAAGAAVVVVPLACKVMLLCTLANMFVSPVLAAALSHSESFRTAIVNTLTAANNNNKEQQAIAVMAATVLHNICISYSKSDSDSDEVVECVSMLQQQVLQCVDSEVVYRLMLALSQLVYANSSAALLLMSLDYDADAIKAKAAAAGVSDTNTKIAQLADDLQLIVAFEMQRLVDE